MTAQSDRSEKTGNECIESRHQRPDQNKHLSRVERSTFQSLEVLLYNPLKRFEFEKSTLKTESQCEQLKISTQDFQYRTKRFGSSFFPAMAKIN